MRPVVWNNAVAEEKIKNFASILENHVSDNRDTWEMCENIYASRLYDDVDVLSINSERYEGLPEEFSDWMVRAQMNHTYTFVRLLSSTLMQNEPITTASPATTDRKSRDAADAADSLIRYARKKYKVRDHADRMVNDTFIHGIGIIRVDFDKNDGELIDAKKAKGKDLDMVFSGEIKLRNPEIRNYTILSTSNSLLDAYGYLEKIYLSKEEAEALYPEFAGKFVSVEKQANDNNIEDKDSKQNEDLVVLYEYFEIARPINGLKGRHVLTMSDFKPIIIEDHPYNHKKLPIVILPDVLINNRLYPIGIVEILSNPQKQADEIMSRILENVKLHSKVFMMVDRNANISKDGLTDLPVVPITYNGTEGKAPYAMPPAALPQFVFAAYENLVQMMQHLSGVREFSRGQMPSRVSGFAANLMIEADTKVHTQLHERFKTAITELYDQMLSLMHQYWTDEKTLSVVGEENEVEEFSFKSSDLNGGYVVVSDFGSSLPIDPAARKQMVQDIAGMAQQFGITLDASRLMSLLKMGDVFGTFDIGKTASKRQKKEIKDMMLTGQYIEVDLEAEDHIAHYTELFAFFQTAEYVALDIEIQQLLKKHAREHMEASQLVKQGVTEQDYEMMKRQGTPQGGEGMGAEATIENPELAGGSIEQLLASMPMNPSDEGAPF